MKKALFVISIVLFSNATFAQVTKETLQEEISFKSANSKIKESGYQFANGWTLRVGDTIHFGKGTLPNHAFTFIYEAPLSILGTEGTGNDQLNGLNSLKAGEANKGIIKRFDMEGTTKGGFTGIAVVGIGFTTRYYVELEDALDGGEIIAPAQYRNNPQAEGENKEISLSDKLKKWKDLLDSGAITQDEYNVQKKKLLGD